MLQTKLPFTIVGSLTSHRDISTELVFCNRVWISPKYGRRLSYLSFDHEVPLLDLVGKMVQVTAFLDEVPHPDPNFYHRELIATEFKPLHWDHGQFGSMRLHRAILHPSGKTSHFGESSLSGGSHLSSPAFQHD